MDSTDHNVPIIYLQDDVYLVGLEKVRLTVQNDVLMITFGKTTDKFKTYMNANYKHFQRMLIVYMIKTGESLEWVLNQLSEGKKIGNISP
jgi:hypothetical protein